MKKVLVGLLFLLVFVILIFQLIGTTSVDLQAAADSITDANNCSSHTDAVLAGGVAGRYNLTDKYCYNATAAGDGKLYLAGQIDLPLNTLFGRSSVLILIFMVSILIISIVTVFKGVKMQK